MSWRITQLGDQPCDQDKLILNLFSNKTVNYVGPDIDFRLWLNHDIESENLILILNSPLWVSAVITTLQTHLTNRVQTFYIGINRYQILGNDTDIFDTGIDNFSTNLINFITKLLDKQGFVVVKSGQYDQDLGRYFNFVQPLTWVYGHNATN